MKSSIYSYFLFFSQLLAFLFLGGLFFFFSYERPFSDYDAVRNHQIILSFLEGDFSAVFSHLSPLFFLAYYPFYYVISRPEVGMWINGFFLLLHLWQWSNWIAKQWNWAGESKIAFTVFYGTSYFIIYQAQCVAIEPLTLFLFGLLWKKNEEKSLHTWLLLALLGLVNYKFLLLLPFLIGRFILQYYKNTTMYDEMWHTLRYMARVLLLTLLFIVLLGWGSDAGVRIYFARAFSYLVKSPFLVIARTTQEIPLDFFFYLKYLLYFENLLLPLGLLLGFRSNKTFFKNNVFLFCFLGGTLLLMSFLPKGPRGLLFAFPLLYAWAWKGLLGKQNKPSLALYIALSISLYFAVSQAYNQLYPKGKSGLEEMASCVQQRNIKTLKTTASLQLWPKVKSTTEVKPLLKFSNLENAEYLLFDDYWHAAQKHSPVFPNAAILCRTPTPELHNPMLFLEHCQFSNRTFDEAMEAWQTHYAPEMRLLRLDEEK